MDWERLRDSLERQDAGPYSILEQLRQQYEDARAGYYQQKVSNRAEEGIVGVTERYPDLMLRITELRYRLWVYVEAKIAESPQDLEPLVIEVVRLEDET